MLALFLSGAAILFTWTVVDVLMHRLLLHRLYAANPALWRPMDKLNIPLIYVVTFALIAAFVLPYWLLVQPKSLGAGLGFGAFLGLALGVGGGFGTYIHMPIPRPLAWAWFLGGWLKGALAGAILGLLVTAA